MGVRSNLGLFQAARRDECSHVPRPITFLPKPVQDYIIFVQLTGGHNIPQVKQDIDWIETTMK